MTDLVKNYLRQMAAAFPIKWDRYVQDEIAYDVYGWIDRKDGKRDFVLLQLEDTGEDLKSGFVTSSAKYSSAICAFMYGEQTEHNSCKKVTI